MFKSARWRSEKNKVKAVFKLQFHATQVVPKSHTLILQFKALSFFSIGFRFVAKEMQEMETFHGFLNFFV